MRFSLLSACLVATICTGIAVAQSPVAYVYVAEDFPSGVPPTSSPITVYAASSSGTLSQIPGSPFTQTSGMLVGTNGTHFLTVDQNGSTTHQYLHVYNVGWSTGVIGSEVSKQDLHEWCADDAGGELDHTGQFVYVEDTQDCGGAYQSFALSKTGQLTFVGSLDAGVNPFGTLPKFSGNDEFAYIFTPSEYSDYPCPTATFLGLARESSGALERISFSETDSTPPAGYTQTVQTGLVTNDPTDHLASLIHFADQGGCTTTSDQLVSYTVESNGDLVTTNTYRNMPQLAGYLALGGGVMKLNPAGTVLAVTVGTGIQFFHFNGANPITTFTGVIGKSGYISTMAWDNRNHLYALNAKSGKLHVYTVTTTGVVEAAGSPYLPPNSCTSGGCWPQNLIVRINP